MHGHERDTSHTSHQKRRALMLRAHLWLSVVGGLLVLLLSATGSILVYGGEIDRELNPELFRATSGDVGVDEVVRRVGEAHPGATVVSVTTPAQLGVYAVALRGDGAPTVYLDPGTGHVLGTRDPSRSFVGRVRTLHRELFAGTIGRIVVGLGGLALLVVTLTGLYLWWPRWERIRHLGFSIRRGRGDFVFKFDLHKVTGILSAPVLAAIAYTGLLLLWGDLPHTALAYMMGGEPYREPAPDYVASQPKQNEGLPLSEFVGIAKRAVPGAAVTSIEVPALATDPAIVLLRLPDDPLAAGSSKVWMDRYTGVVRARVNADKLSTPDWLFRSWRLGIHAGAYGGAVTRALHMVAGLVPIALMWTGLVLWGRRRRFARDASRRRGRRTVGERVPSSPSLDDSIGDRPVFS